MFEPSSRYDAVETTQLTTAEGRVIRYKRRRFLPPPDELTVLGEVTVVPGDRLDLIAARSLGDPELFWRICDANDAIDPFELSRPGRRLRVPMPRR